MRPSKTVLAQQGGEAWPVQMDGPFPRGGFRPLSPQVERDVELVKFACVGVVDARAVVAAPGSGVVANLSSAPLSRPKTEVFRLFSSQSCLTFARADSCSDLTFRQPPVTEGAPPHRSLPSSSSPPSERRSPAAPLTWRVCEQDHEREFAACLPEVALLPLAVLSPHVHLSHLYPRGVVDDAVHDGVGVDAAVEPGMPVLLLELRAEDRGGLLESPLHHLEHEGAEALVGLLEQPFVQHEQLEVRHLPHELGVAPGLIDGEPALLYSVTSKST